MVDQVFCVRHRGAFTLELNTQPRCLSETTDNSCHGNHASTMKAQGMFGGINIALFLSEWTFITKKLQNQPLVQERSSALTEREGEEFKLVRRESERGSREDIVSESRGKPIRGASLSSSVYLR